ncbi:MAG: ABC transporter permease, partial [Candidatus Hodarchaeales archaeon]
MHPYIGILTLLWKQVRWPFIIIWGLIFGWIPLVMLVYPGEKELKEFIDVLQSEQFELILGTLPVDASQYLVGIWIHFGLLSWIPFTVFIIGLFFGIELITREQAEKTFDSTFSTPQHRLTFIAIRFLGFLIISTVLIISGIFFTIIPIVLMNIEYDFTIIYQLWFIMGIQMFFGLSLGMFIGSVVFDRSLGFQFAFFLGTLSVIIFMFINGAGSQLSSDQLDILTYFSIVHYLKSGDILYHKKFDLSVINPLFIGGLILILLSLIIFNRRDLNESKFRPIHVYLNPMYWINRNKHENINQNNYDSSSIPMSRWLVAWSLKLKSRFPILVDELWSHGLFLT